VLIFISFRHSSSNLHLMRTTVNSANRYEQFSHLCFTIIVQMFQIPLHIVRTCIMVLCINVLYNVPFLRNVKSYFELHVKQNLNTGSVWTKIQFAQHNSVLHCTSNLHTDTTHFHLMHQFNALPSITCTVLTEVC
jgi:hypothetical protein